MTNQDHDQKKRECWEEFRLHVVCGTDNPKGWFERAFDRAYSLGKQEKDADTVTISKDKYYKLCKCGRYMANWVPYFDVCPICGEYNQRGCICINCDNDKNWNNGE